MKGLNHYLKIFVLLLSALAITVGGKAGTADSALIADTAQAKTSFMKDEAASGDNRSTEAFSKAVDLLLNIRQQAKQNKDWATSDRIRNELSEIGFEIHDTRDGAEWKLD